LEDFMEDKTYGVVLSNVGIWTRIPIEFKYSEGCYEWEHLIFYSATLDSVCYEDSLEASCYLSKSIDSVEAFIKGFSTAGDMVKEFFNV